MTAMLQVTEAAKSFTMHLQGGIRLPVVMGVTFAGVGPMVAMANANLAITSIFGAVIAAGVGSGPSRPLATTSAGIPTRNQVGTRDGAAPVPALVVAVAFAVGPTTASLILSVWSWPCCRCFPCCAPGSCSPRLAAGGMPPMSRNVSPRRARTSSRRPPRRFRMNEKRERGSRTP